MELIWCAATGVYHRLSGAEGRLSGSGDPAQ
jgi:hypothetical protein